MPKVAALTEIGPGKILRINLQGTPVAVVNVGGRFYAFSDVCTHLGCSLSDGSIEGELVTCSCGSQFDIASGHAVVGPAQNRIRTYRVQIEGGEIRI